MIQGKGCTACSQDAPQEQIQLMNSVQEESENQTPESLKPVHTYFFLNYTYIVTIPQVLKATIKSLTESVMWLKMFMVLTFKYSKHGDKMKKILLLVLILGTIIRSTVIFAETPVEFIVQSFTGKVEYESSPGVWEAVTKELKVLPVTRIYTGLNSRLVVKAGEKLFTIAAMQKGSLNTLIMAERVPSSGIKLGAQVKKAEATGAIEKSRKSVSTASTRADDASQDMIWVDE